MEHFPQMAVRILKTALVHETVVLGLRESAAAAGQRRVGHGVHFLAAVQADRVDDLRVPAVSTMALSVNVEKNFSTSNIA
jgi:hypothetical protein